MASVQKRKRKEINYADPVTSEEEEEDVDVEGKSFDRFVQLIRATFSLAKKLNNVCVCVEFSS